MQKSVSFFPRGANVSETFSLSATTCRRIARCFCRRLNILRTGTNNETVFFMRPIHEAYDSTKQQAGGTLEIVRRCRMARWLFSISGPDYVAERNPAISVPVSWKRRVKAFWVLLLRPTFHFYKCPPAAVYSIIRIFDIWSFSCTFFRLLRRFPSFIILKFEFRCQRVQVNDLKFIDFHWHSLTDTRVTETLKESLGAP